MTERSIQDRLREGVTVLDEPFHHAALEEAMLEAARYIDELEGDRDAWKQRTVEAALHIHKSGGSA